MFVWGFLSFGQDFFVSYVGTRVCLSGSMRRCCRFPICQAGRFLHCTWIVRSGWLITRFIVHTVNATAIPHDVIQNHKFLGQAGVHKVGSGRLRTNKHEKWKTYCFRWVYIVFPSSCGCGFVGLWFCGYVGVPCVYFTSFPDCPVSWQKQEEGEAGVDHMTQCQDLTVPREDHTIAVKYTWVRS